MYLHALAAAVEWEAAETEEGSSDHWLYFTTRNQQHVQVKKRKEEIGIKDSKGPVLVAELLLWSSNS